MEHEVGHHNNVMRTEKGEKLPPLKRSERKKKRKTIEDAFQILNSIFHGIFLKVGPRLLEFLPSFHNGSFFPFKVWNSVFALKNVEHDFFETLSNGLIYSRREMDPDKNHKHCQKYHSSMLVYLASPIHISERPSGHFTD